VSLWHLNNGHLRLRFHPGQARAWASDRRIVAIFAGTQGGKTSFEPWWLWREIGRCGAGDYLAVTATYDLFKLKLLPALLEVFEHLLGAGRYWAANRVIELADPATGRFRARHADDPMWGRIILRSAESEGGLEASTAHAAIVDEAGQDSFTVESWWAILRRVALALGRVLLGTTIYNLGWTKAQIYDRWAAGDPTYDVIQFDSVENPAFPRAEYERARGTMPAWRFNMQYRGLFERPVGLIYDSFDDKRHVIPRFALPDAWPRYLGLDFGGVHTAGMAYAENPATGQLVAYREYLAGGRTIAEHAAALLAGETQGFRLAVGGSKSEGQWRAEFGAAGLPVHSPEESSVEVGIARVYAQHKQDGILVFDDLAGYRSDKGTYRRVLDANNEPTEAIADKSTFHRLDAERYIIGYLRPGYTAQRYTEGPYG
jgi:hypothetical protein